MGDGKGGKENVSKEIEHEEQLEGLKNYESDQEKDEKQEQAKAFLKNLEGKVVPEHIMKVINCQENKKIFS